MASSVPTTRPYVLLAWLMASALLVEVALYLIAARTPPDVVLGVAQKIFYFHVGSAFAMLLGLSFGAIFSLVDLLKPTDKVDAMARACIETGVVFGAIVLTSGPLWARKSWGTYWTWEPRLTLSLLTELLAISVIAVRGMAPSSQVGRRAAAAMAVMAAPAAYLIHVAVKLWGGNHPQVVQGSGGGIRSPEMRLAFTVSVIAILSFAGVLIALRYRGIRLEQRAMALKLRLSALGVRAARRLSAAVAASLLVVATWPAQSWAEGARDLSKYKEESVPGGVLLVAAYLVLWALVAAFVGRAVMAQSRVEAEVKDLQERIDLLEEDAAGNGDGASA